MKIVIEKDTKTIRNSATSSLLEYSGALKDKEVDFAINTINGRYPEKGYCANKECKELVYVLGGEGTLNKQDQCLEFKTGDVLLIEKGEIYFWKSDCKLIMSCTPAWHKEQCQLIDDCEL